MITAPITSTVTMLRRSWPIVDARCFACELSCPARATHFSTRPTSRKNSRCNNTPITIVTSTRVPISTSFSVSGINGSWNTSSFASIGLTSSPALRGEARDRLLVEALHHRDEQLHGLIEVAAIDDAHVAVDVARRDPKRQRRHSLPHEMDAAGVGAAALDRLELERQLELLR